MSFAGARQCGCLKYPSWQLTTNPRPARNWVVVQRKENRSCYNGARFFVGRLQRSRWSHVLCLSCGAHWRTQAGYVDRLPDIEEDQKRLCYGKLRQSQPADPTLLEKLNQLRFDFARRRESSPQTGADRLDSAIARPRSTRRPARGKR